MRLYGQDLTPNLTSNSDLGDDTDCQRFLDLLGEVPSNRNWLCHTYGLMTNRYHLLVETLPVNLSKGVRQRNGGLTQYSK